MFTTDPGGTALVKAVLLMLIAGSTLSISAQETQSPESAPSLIGLGRAMSTEEIAALPRHVFADGQGLPAGSGNATTGFKLFAQHCASCHGSAGEGGRALELVGDRSLLATEYPDRGIAVYWPYAPTLFEYIQRSMPPANPFSLSDDEVYAVIAALLVFNGLIPLEQEVDANVLADLQMPNRDGFRSLHEHLPVH